MPAATCGSRVGAGAGQCGGAGLPARARRGGGMAPTAVSTPLGSGTVLLVDGPIGRTSSYLGCLDVTREGQNTTGNQPQEPGSPGVGFWEQSCSSATPYANTNLLPPASCAPMRARACDAAVKGLLARPSPDNGKCRVVHVLGSMTQLAASTPLRMPTTHAFPTCTARPQLLVFTMLATQCKCH